MSKKKNIFSGVNIFEDGGEIVKYSHQLISIEPSITDVFNVLNNSGHQCFIVGGAVRDAILGIQPKDIDIEVYNISYNELNDILSKYGTVNLIGKNFGIIKFNPYGGESLEYDFSIPRKENKIGIGHKGFEVSFDVDMGIKDAALRRDFSFNALAYDPIENIVYDYFGGIEDIKNKIIRHTSDKFSEDYLRILRAMQFQARFDFTIHTDTIEMMREMLVLSDEYSQLPKERIYEEFKKWAEKGIRHDLIFQFMRDTGLIKYYPILESLKETPQDEIYHPEGDVEVHSTLCLRHMDKIIERDNITGDEKIILIISILLHDIGKNGTTEHKMKRGRLTITSEGHEALGGKMSLEFLASLGFHESLIIPISNLVTNHLSGVNISMITAHSGKVKAVKKLSRRLFPATIHQLLYVMDADSNGRGWAEYKEPTGAKDISEIAKEIKVTDNQYEYILKGRHLIEAGLKPSLKFGEILRASNEAQENGEFSDIEGAKMWLGEYLKKNNINPEKKLFGGVIDGNTELIDIAIGYKELGMETKFV